MPAKMLPRRAATYPEICMSGPIGQFQDKLRSMGKLKDIHDLASRMVGFSQKWGFDQDKTELFVQWSLHQWLKSNKPIFLLEEDLAWALSNTEPPMENFDLLPQIPIDGMFISLPPVFEIGGGGSNAGHKIEGIFLTYNEVLCPKEGIGEVSGPLTEVTPETLAKYDIVPSITVVGIGEDKRPASKANSAFLRDDLVLYFSLVPGKPLYLHEDEHQGQVELARVVTNLLYLLQNTRELSEVQDPPLPESLLGEARSARRERERDLSKGRSCLRHTVWKLSTLKRRPPQKSEEGVPEERKVRGHIVLGHIHRYWVLDPGEEKVLQTKTSSTPKTKTYHLVAKWVLPYKRGEGPIEKSPKVILRK